MRVLILGAGGFLGSLRLASLPEEAISGARTMNLPGLTVTAGDIENAVARRTGTGTAALVQWRGDPQVQQIIDGWPKNFTSERALATGFTADASADALVDAFVASERAVR